MPQCRTCQAEMIWVKTPKGKNIPLDEEPTGDGDFDIVDGVAIFAGRGKGQHHCHFETCPDSDEHRKPRESNPPTITCPKCTHVFVGPKR